MGRGKPIAVAIRHGHALKECAAIDGQTLRLMIRVDRSQEMNNIDRLTDRQKDSIEKAEEISPNDTHIKREHARFYACNRKYKNTTRATALYEEAVRCAINDPERRLTARIDLINHTAIQSKDYQLKLQQLRDMIPDFETPDHKIDIRDQIARCYMNKLHDFPRAIEVIEATLEQFPSTRARSSAKTLRALIKRLSNPGNGEEHQELLEQDDMKLSAMQLYRLLFDYVFPALIFSISTHPIDFRELLVNNADSFRMRSFFIRYRKRPLKQLGTMRFSLEDDSQEYAQCVIYTSIHRHRGQQ